MACLHSLLDNTWPICGSTSTGSYKGVRLGDENVQDRHCNKGWCMLVLFPLPQKNTREKNHVESHPTWRITQIVTS